MAHTLCELLKRHEGTQVSLRRQRAFPAEYTLVVPAKQGDENPYVLVEAGADLIRLAAAGGTASFVYRLVRFEIVLADS